MEVEEQTAAGVLDSSGSRADGRLCEEARTDFLVSSGVLSRANGSSFVQLGTTKVTVAIHGPKPHEGRAAYNETGELKVTVQQATFSGRPDKGNSKAQNIEDRNLEQLLRDTFETILLLDKYPKAVIEVHALVLERGGSEAAALIMATGLAAMDGQLDMRCVPSASTVITIGSHMLLDPTAAEAQVADRQVLVAMDAARGGIAHIVAGGVFSAAELEDAVQLAASACAVWHADLRGAALQRLHAQEAEAAR